ncbi:hypothetical protein E8E15_001619 [Penicillium rubens]|nr:hypothetical protein E8E15_001619 [Penicillium rubens]
MPKPSNEKRMRLNRQCREALAAHIYSRLDIEVAPEKVRLQPRPGDGYAWSVTSSVADLFKSSLSSCNIHLYQSIREGIGHSFEAVFPQPLGTSQPITSGFLEAEGVGGQKNGSFTEEICKLKATNSHIETQLEHARGQLDESLREGHTLHVEIDQLRRNMQVLEVQNKKLRDELAETRAGIAGVMQTLN